MITYTTIGYNDIYPGVKPAIADLLDGINSKIPVVLMAMINAELVDEHDVEEVQLRLTRFVCHGFPPKEAAHVFKSIADFRKKVNGPVSIWGKRYAMEFLKYEFLHYRDIDKIENTPAESVRIFKAYLLIADEMNEKDRQELAAVRAGMNEDDPMFFEKMVWPFVLSQFDTNNRVNPISQFFRLFALLKYSITHPELLNFWKEFIQLNGFDKLRNYLGSANFLITVAQTRIPANDWMKVFSWINAKDLPAYLFNLSFNYEQFAAVPAKQIDYLGFRERPLFQTDGKTFVAIDLDFLLNKIYTGPLFDLYYQTEMRQKSSFATFADFKSHIATEVSEKIVFKGILTKIFEKKHVIIHFDEEGKDMYPDCYIRSGKRIILIEFKDYLFPGKLVEDHSFDQIKKHLDTKFIKNEKGKNKGISQIVEQIKVIGSDQFEFDKFDENNITIYPVLVHTNFMYQMPGINHYLNEAFTGQLKKVDNDKLKVRPLTLLDLDRLFDFLQVEGMDTKMLAEFLDRYVRILENRKKYFEKHVSQDNFVRARSSFDEVYATIIERDVKIKSVEQRVSRFMESIDLKEDMLDAF